MKFKIKERIRDRFLWGVIGIIVIHTITNIVWLKKDTFPLWFDYGGYFKRSIEMYYASQLGFIEFIKAALGIGAYSSFFHPYRVMLPLSSVPWYYLFGLSEDTAVISCAVFLLITLLSTYAIASRICNKTIAFLAVFILSVSPGFFTFSRRYSLEFAATSIITLTAFFLLCSDKFTNKRYSILFGISFGLCMLTKEMSFAFIPGIAAYVFISGYLSAVNRDTKKLAFHNFFTSLFIVITIILPIYWLHKEKIISAIFDIAYSPKVRQLYGMPPLYSLSSFTFYLKEIFNFSFLPPYSLFFIFGVFICIIKKLNNAGFLISWLFVSYLMLSLTPVKAGYYAVPLLIPISIITSYGINKIFKNNKVRAILLFIIIVWGILNFLNYSFPNLKSSHSPIFKKPDGYNNYLYPIDEDWKLADIADYIKNNLSSLDRAASVHIGANLYPFSSMTFAYVAMLKKLPLVFGGYSVKPGEALSFDFVIVKEGDNQGMFYSEAQAKELKQLLDRAPNFIKLPKTFVLPDNSVVSIYKNKL